MMSKRLFFKAMGEDLRHKLWMIALSVLGNFLAMPVSWLLVRNNMARGMEDKVYFISRIYSFFGDFIMLSAGCVAVLGAFIVGLYGFRYLFRQMMVDTYHSLPMRRGALYGMYYVDGFLIWFVPASVNLLFAVAMAGGFAYRQGGLQTLVGMCATAAVSLFVLTVAFLLVYNMVLVAVMLSGNVLNALVVMVILGFGVIAVYMLGILFFTIYMETFHGSAIWEDIAYSSPFFTAIFLLAARCGLEDGSWELWRMLLAGLGVAAVLGGCTWMLYKRRASELAGQGLQNRVVGILLKMVIGVAAGMCGWQLFVMIVLDSLAVGWGIFGAILAAVMVFGILDVIFRMEFRAFFAHKFQMGVTVAAALFVCFSFYWDWFGYDEYLPGKDEIAEIAVYDRKFTNRPYVSATDNLLEHMAFRDAEVIYAYLEAVTSTQAALGTENTYPTGSYDLMETKVTLKNGRSYYRKYRVLKEDKEEVWPLLVSGEYMKYAYCIEEERAAGCRGLVLTRGGESIELDGGRPEMAASIIRAYNEDVMADPETVLLGKGRLLVRLEILLGMEWNGMVLTLDIYESMEHVLEALESAGCRQWITPAEASDIRCVELPLDVYGEEPIPKEAVIARARDMYGVYREETPEQAVSGERGFGIYQETGGEDWEEGEDVDYTITVTDRTEVEELLGLASLVLPYRGGNVFRKDYVDIRVEDMEGKISVYYIRKGLLPEKYILRFGAM